MLSYSRARKGQSRQPWKVGDQGSSRDLGAEVSALTIPGWLHRHPKCWTHQIAWRWFYCHRKLLQWGVL